MNQYLLTQAMEDEEAQICPTCGNVYKVELLKEGDDFNDFGYRHCPFCGLIIDEYENIRRRLNHVEHAYER